MAKSMLRWVPLDEDNYIGDLVHIESGRVIISDISLYDACLAVSPDVIRAVIK